MGMGMVASLVMVTKTAIADYIRLDRLSQFKKPMSPVEELKTTATLLPLFLSNTAFKVVSFAITAALLRHWALLSSLVPPLLYWSLQTWMAWDRLVCSFHQTDIVLQS